MPSHREVASRLNDIESEMKRIGYWREAPLPPGMYQFSQAFAMDTMPFACWLQFIFIPRVRSIIETNGDFPPTSMVAAQAVREFDGEPGTGPLVSALGKFDALFS
jgi:uncharacterized protein YqcC (DUF446 family)